MNMEKKEKESRDRDKDEREYNLFHSQKQVKETIQEVMVGHQIN